MNLLRSLILSILFTSTAINAQFSLKTGNLLSSGTEMKAPGIDTLFIVENLNNTTLQYTHTDSTDFSWSIIRLENGVLSTPQLIPSSITSNKQISELRISEPCGYEIEIGPGGNSTKKYIWVINYDDVLPTLDSVVVYDNYRQMADSCNHIIVQAFSSADSILIGDITTNNIVKLTRQQSIQWTAQPTLNFSNTEFRTHLFTPNIPYEDTRFSATLFEKLLSEGSVFNTDIERDTLYEPVAVKLESIVATIITRENNNELEKEITGEVKGSAPLNVNFATKGTNSKVLYYDWEILALTEADSQRISFALDSFRYEFRNDINDNAEPDYVARVNVSNDFCSAKNKTEIKIVSSYLDASNILILGFGANDDIQQFKVVFKSIKPESFRGAIYNRWGRRVYSWTNPELGWDGRFNGKYVSPGVYYYVITATGTDGESWKIKRDLNVIREKGIK